MSKLSVIGYPRIGAQRELKKWTEAYFAGKLPVADLQKNAAKLRQAHWTIQNAQGIDYIPSNDFSFYDLMLDTAYLLNIIPARYRQLQLSPLETYFAMAKGYQTDQLDVKALPMKKWFNTNYHYIVPAIEAGMEFKVNNDKPFMEYQEALALGIKTKPVLIGPFTFMKLVKVESGEFTLSRLASMLTDVYLELIQKFQKIGVEWLQLDEPSLVMDLSVEDIALVGQIYQTLLSKKGNLKILLQTYFGDIRDIYHQLTEMNFDAIGLDFIEGQANLDCLEHHGFPANKLLFAGVVNGKNIWKNNYHKTLQLLHRISETVDKKQIVMGTSCSLLHVPYTVTNEAKLDFEARQQLAFAEEKLVELKELAALWNTQNYENDPVFKTNTALITAKNEAIAWLKQSVRDQVASLTEKDFVRSPVFEERNPLQKSALNLPLLPTTTIGSFPQTVEIRNWRKAYRNGEMTFEAYDAKIKEKISEIIRVQEEIGLDVLVHGEYERTDMVEYFGQNLAGFLFTQNGWVQSYGTRCVKPPIIFGDVERLHPITVDYIAAAQRLTKKPVKGMLTGPVTILNWSFVREDLPLAEVSYQLGLAIKAEVMDLEAAGIKIIQIDEAAFREKLPLRKSNWQSYLDWTIRSFGLTHATVHPETQIHTHMCYSEFTEIIKAIEALDADVFTFEAARSDLSILVALKESGFRMETGPGVYDIHSPRIPSKDELKQVIKGMIEKIPLKKLWVNPDCGLKTRGMEETVASLKNMVAAVQELRQDLVG